MALENAYPTGISDKTNTVFQINALLQKTKKRVGGKSKNCSNNQTFYKKERNKNPSFFKIKAQTFFNNRDEKKTRKVEIAKCRKTHEGFWRAIFQKTAYDHPQSRQRHRKASFSKNPIDPKTLEIDQEEQKPKEEG